MRQSRWFELIKDYDCTIDYHPGKANIVVDALSRKSRSSQSSLNVVRTTLFTEFRSCATALLVSENAISVRPKLIDEVIKKQSKDPIIRKLIEEVKAQQRMDYELRFDGTLLKHDRVCLRKDLEIKQVIG